MKLKALTAAFTAASITVSAGAFTAFADSGDVEINETNFPDGNFRRYVSKKCDNNGDGVLSQSEINAVTSIYVPEQKIADLKGIEHFTALKSFSCSDNQLTNLDVSKNTALVWLNCLGNQLTNINVSGCTALTQLICNGNRLTELDVSKNLVLKELQCFENQLSSLDVSNNTALTSLHCSDNQLTGLDVGNNVALTSLYCDHNQLTSLDVRNNANLNFLTCGGNQLTSLDMSKNIALGTLGCGKNQLTSLDLSKNTALNWLECRVNKLTSLDVSNNPKLETLSCGDNHLTSIDLSANTVLLSVDMEDNTYFIGKSTNYDLKNLPGNFDVSKASDWQGATCEKGVLTNFTSDKITYTYDCGNGKSATFTLNVVKESDPIADFVERLYTTLLGRASEEEGKAGWVADLKNGRTAADVASGFVLSEELKNQNLSSGEFVDRMYRTFLDREADEAGKTDWVSILDNGCSYAYILNSFAGSQEFHNLCDSYKITAGTYESTEPRDKNPNLTSFVSRMYTKALNRSYDVNGLNDWTNDYLAGKATANDIAYGFILSQEFEGRNLTNEQYVDTLYRTFFDREPDAGGKAGWLDELAKGTSRKDVLDGFLGAEEFANLKASFGV